jgi:hypothetical protein
VPFKATLHRAFGRTAEPQILFPLIAGFLLTAIWGTTLGVLKVRHADAEHTAAISSRELLGTYEAQVVRALREIDQTLNLVKFWPERQAGHHTLADLKEKGLLPPDLIFTVSIADKNGTSWRALAHRDNRASPIRTPFASNISRGPFFIGQLPRGPMGDAKLRVQPPVE